MLRMGASSRLTARARQARANKRVWPPKRSTARSRAAGSSSRKCTRARVAVAVVVLLMLVRRCRQELKAERSLLEARLAPTRASSPRDDSSPRTGADATAEIVRRFRHCTPVRLTTRCGCCCRRCCFRQSELTERLSRTEAAAAKALDAARRAAQCLAEVERERDINASTAAAQIAAVRCARRRLRALASHARTRWQLEAKLAAATSTSASSAMSASSNVSSSSKRAPSKLPRSVSAVAHLKMADAGARRAARRRCRS